MNQPHATPDPRSAILAFLSIAIWISTTASLWGTLAWLLAVVVLVVIGNRRTRSSAGLRGTLKWALPFTILILCLYALLAAGDDAQIWRLGPITISREGLSTGGTLALRFLAFVILARTLTIVLTPTGLATGVTRFLWPLKALGVGIESVYYLMFFIARMVPVLTEEARIIQFGQRSRGLAPASSWYRRVTASAALIIPVFAASMRRSERLSLALTSRGFNPSRLPAAVTAQRFGGLDWLMLAGVVTGWAIWTYLNFM